jgi:hypothetical protein
MVNRRVDQLPATAPDDPAVPAAEAQRLVTEGYPAPSAAPEREGTSRWRYAHTLIATLALRAITMLPLGGTSGWHAMDNCWFARRVTGPRTGPRVPRFAGTLSPLPALA